MSESSKSSKTLGKRSVPLWMSAVLALVAAAPASIGAMYSYQADTEVAAVGAEAKIATDEIQREIANLHNEIDQQRVDLEAERLRFEQEIERLDLENRTIQVSLEQQRFEADVQNRQDLVIRDYVPLLFSPSDEDVNSALAVLFVLYPNEAKDMLARVSESQGEEFADFLQPAIERAESLAEATGDWVAVVSSFQSRDSALEHAAEINKGGIYGATVYLIGGYYTTTVGVFPTKESALSETIRIRDDLNTGAFVLNLNSACPRQVERDGYFECFE